MPVFQPLLPVLGLPTHIPGSHAHLSAPLASLGASYPYSRLTCPSFKPSCQSWGFLLNFQSLLPVFQPLLPVFGLQLSTSHDGLSAPPAFQRASSLTFILLCPSFRPSCKSWGFQPVVSIFQSLLPVFGIPSQLPASPARLSAPPASLWDSSSKFQSLLPVFQPLPPVFTIPPQLPVSPAHLSAPPDSLVVTSSTSSPSCQSLGFLPILQPFLPNP